MIIPKLRPSVTQVADVIFLLLGATVATVVFIRYRSNLLPDFITSYIPYYLLIFCIMLLIILIAIIRELRNKSLNAFFFLPYFLATLLVAMASNKNISDTFSPLVAVTIIFGFLCTICTFLSAVAQHQRTNKDEENLSHF